MATSLSLPSDSRLKIGGLFLASTYASIPTICGFTFSNFGLFPRGGAFACFVTAVNSQGFPIVVAVGQPWGEAASGIVGTNYKLADPGQSILLPGGQYVGLAMRTTPIPAEYADQQLTLSVSPYSDGSTATIGAIPPFTPTAWLYRTFTAKSLSITVSPSGVITGPAPTPLPPPPPPPSITTTPGTGKTTPSTGTTTVTPSEPTTTTPVITTAVSPSGTVTQTLTGKTAPAKTGFLADLSTAEKVALFGGGAAALAGIVAMVGWG